MNKQSDQELLRAWSRDRCEESFRTLVDRYADLVFGTAVRRTGDRPLAEEVSQNVFTVLARKAGQLDGSGGIGGWLFKTTVLEAASRRRSEARRDKRMRELEKLESALRSAGSEAMAGEAAQAVDEGLARLGSAERNVLISRFFNGDSYGEMAAASGRSEAACRKHVSRALEKLGTVLEGRGVRVSTTVLAAGLGALMTTKAPAGLAGSCAATAMRVCSAGAGTGFFTTIATTMTVTKFTSVLVIGGVLLVMSTGTGYLVGRSKAKERAELTPSAGRAGAGLPRQKSEGRRAGASAEARGGSDPSGTPDETRVQAILNALKKELRGKGWETALEVGPPLAEKLRPSDMEEAFALISRERDEALRQTVTAVLYRTWFALDGPAAIEHALAQDSDLIKQVALGQGVPAWSADDPQGALAWQAEIMKRDPLPVDEKTAGRLLGLIMRGWSQRDMDGAWDHYESLSLDQQRAALNNMDNLVVEEEYRAAMVSRIAAIEDEKVRSQVIEEVGEVWARLDPRAAAAWFDTVKFDDPMLRLRAGMEIGESWFATDPAAAANWLWPMVPEEMRGTFASQLARSPLGEDKAALGAWLAERGYNADGTPGEEQR